MSRSLSMMERRLRFAVMRQDVDDVRRLLAAGACVPADENGQAVLLIDAVQTPGKDAEELLSLLLGAGCAVRAVRTIGPDFEMTAVTEAARHGRLDLLLRLVEAGADIHWCDSTGSNAASAALDSRSWRDSGDSESLREWLRQRGVKFNPASSDCRRKLYMAASRAGSWPDIPWLEELGVSPAPLQWTPFMWKIVRRTATVDDVAGLPADELERMDCVNRTPLFLAICANRMDLAEALLDRGASIQVNGSSALHCAAASGHVEMIEWLVKTGVPVDIPDDFGDTPLRTAVNEGHEAAAGVLLKCGADAKAADANGFQSIHETADMALLTLLLDAGADVNAISGGGTWPLAEAAGMGEPAVVKFLLERGAQVDLAPATEETALFHAVRSDSLECVHLLLDAGANILTESFDGWNCLWELRSEAMARLLLERGADPCHRSPLGLAEDWLIPLAVGEFLRAARLSRMTASPPLASAAE